MDGKIVIGTEIDTAGFEKDLKKLEQEDIDLKAKLDASDIEIPEDKAKEIADELETNLKLDLDTQSFDVEIAKVKAELLTYQTALQNADKLELSDQDMFDLSVAIEKAYNRLVKLTKQKEKLNRSGLDKLKDSFESIGKSVKKTVSSIGRWALAIFGIRGAMMALRSSLNIITQNDKQLKADIEFIKTALAYTLEPVIRAIVNLMKVLVQYVAYVVKAWTGKDIFASARKNLKAGEKSAKAINKSMAGFDEATTLQNNSSSGSSGVQSDITGLEKGEVPSWLQWIVDNKDVVISGLAGIASGLIAIKAGLTGIEGLGVGIAAAGLVQGIQDIIKYINDPAFVNFVNILRDIALIVLGIAITFGAWPVALGAAVALMVIELVKYYDEILGIFDSLKEWLDTNVLGWLKEHFGTLGEILYLPIEYFVTLAKNLFKNFYGGIKEIFEGIMMIIEGDFWGGIKKVFGGLAKTMTAPLRAFWETAKSIVGKIWTLFKEIGTKVGDVIGAGFKLAINAVLGAIEKILNVPIKAINKLIDVINVLPKVDIGKLPTFNFPRLAKGGIVNLPGKGVPVGGALTGEAGPEGVIPFSNTQQMQLIGEAIGRYVTINLTNVIKMNARQLAKEMKTVSAENDFATNS